MLSWFLQIGLQVFLVVVAVLSVPVLLLGKPVYLYWLHNGGHRPGLYRVRIFICLLPDTVQSWRLVTLCLGAVWRIQNSRPRSKYLTVTVRYAHVSSSCPCVLRDTSVCGATVRRSSTWWGIMTWRRAAVTAISPAAESARQMRSARQNTVSRSCYASSDHRCL